MTATAGHLTIVSVSAADSDYYIVEGLDSASVSLLRDLLDVTEFGDTHHDQLSGLKDGNATISGWFTEESNGAGTLRQQFADKGYCWLQVEWQGSTGFNVKCVVSGYSASMARDGRVDWSASLEFVAAHDTDMSAAAQAGSGGSGPYAGHAGSVKITGTATALTNEACSDLGSDVWQITDSTKRIIDPDTAVVITDADGVVGATEYSVNYLFGTITFTVAPNTSVDVTGKYLPVWTVSTAQEASLECSADINDVTVFGDTAHDKDYGLKSATVSLSALEHGLDDYDTGGTSVTFDDVYANASRKVVELNLGSSGVIFRQFCFENQADVSSSPDGLVGNSLSFTSTEVTTADSTNADAFAFSDD